MTKVDLFVSAILGFALSLGGSVSTQAGEFSNAWHSKNTSIVLDAYEYTPIDWTKMHRNKRLTGFINKASDGLSPKSRCGRNALCRVTWRRYAATKELYHTRKVLAKKLGMKWGAYHLARPGNPVAQAEHFLNFANPDKDDLVALDIEHNDPKRWMSLADAEVFAKHIRKRIGRYPVLYTNHSTSRFIATHRAKYPLLSRLNLWYARYKNDMTGAFPMGHWDSYTIWQFSSMVNCNDKTCPWRINGAGNWIDVNVVNLPPAELRREWPFSKLRANKKSDASLQVASNNSSLNEVDSMTTGSIPVSSDGKSPVKRASLNIELPAPKMAILGKTITPTWRAGAKIIKRYSLITSDQIIAKMREAGSITGFKLPASTKVQAEKKAKLSVSVVYKPGKQSITAPFPGDIPAKLNPNSIPGAI